jgi:hypothetical protein
MIVCPGKFVICNPTKTGAHSFKSLALKSDGELIWFKETHTTVVPQKYRDLDRVLIVRNPYDRFVSMFHHVRREPVWASVYDEVKDMDYLAFVNWFSRMRREWMGREDRTTDKPPWLWLYSLSEYGDIFWKGAAAERCLFIRLEDEPLHALKERYGLKITREELYRNNTSDRARGKDGAVRRKEVRRLNVGWAKRVVDKEWAEHDCEVFRYE